MRYQLVEYEQAEPDVQAIYDDPDIIPKLVEAEMTPALKRHTGKIDNVALYARNVGPMFERAEATRPAQLLTPKNLAGTDTRR